MMSKVRILVIEDEPGVSMMIVYLMTRAGVDVQAALTGKKGMELAQEDRFDLIVLDVDLPDLDGFEIYSELKQRHLTCNTPIVFVSASATIEDQQRALELGVADFIEKPFNAQDFVSRTLSHVEFKNGPIEEISESSMA